MSAGKKRKRFIFGEYIEFARCSQTTKGPFAAEIRVWGWLLTVQSLTGGADVRASSGDDQALDFCSAAEAVFSGHLIDIELSWESTGVAVTATEISDG